MKVHLPVRQAILNRRTYEAPAERRLGKIRLDFNENTGGCSKAVLRALARLTPQQIAMYPEYEKSSKRLAKYFGVRREEMLLTNGGDDALRVFFDAFVDPGSSILICEPTFPMYRYYAEIYGARIDVVRYNEQMRFPLAATIAALQKKPRVMFVANPNNPTGTLLTAAEIKSMLAAAPRTAVVLDEAYVDFSGMTVVPWIRKHPQLFVTRTFSKAAGLASLRLGAAIACKESLNYLRSSTPPFPVNVPALVAAEAATRDQKAIRAWVNSVKRLRSWFAVELAKIGVKIFPSAANFLLADFGPRGPQLFRALHRKGILVRDRSKDMGPGFVRITIGTKAEMHKLMSEIKKSRKTTV
jgi:histidinol-phosphate aminotransferase